MRLRPDGIEDRQSLGSTFIPWEAFDGVDFPAHAGSPHRILLNVSRPELIRKRLRRSGELTMVSSLSTDSVFLAGVIHRYAQQPGARQAIGTVAERDRLIDDWRSRVGGLSAGGLSAGGPGVDGPGAGGRGGGAAIR